MVGGAKGSKKTNAYDEWCIVGGLARGDEC